MSAASVELALRVDPSVFEATASAAAIRGLQFASFTGELVIPVAWNAEHPRLAAVPPGTKSFVQPRNVKIGPPTRSGDFDIYQWEIFDLLPGRYEILSLDPPHAIQAVLAPEGTANIRIEVPPPSRLYIRVFDAQTNEDVNVRLVVCTPKRADGSLYPMACQAARDAETGAYVVLCPPGDTRLTCPQHNLIYGEAQLSMTISPGDNHATMPLVKLAGVRLSVQDGVSSFQPSTKQFDIREVDGEGYAMVWDGISEPGVMLAKVTHPGRYRVTVQKLPAIYLDATEQTVDLMPGTMTDVVIRLVRKP